MKFKNFCSIYAKKKMDAVPGALTLRFLRYFQKSIAKNATKIGNYGFMK